MPKLPVVSGIETIKALRKIGYEADHQKGSHIILRNREPPYRRLTVPNHREIHPKTLKSILREAGLTTEGFVELL